jgi:hypothetical protein
MTKSGSTPPASVLQAPSSSFSKLDIKAKEVRPSELVRSGPRNSGEPYFGKLGLHRFDDPGCTYGTCYRGFDLSTALAETLLHDVSAVNGQFVVERSRFNARWIVRFDDVPGQVLKLADMTGASLLKAGGDAALSAIWPYDVPQRWSQQLHGHPYDFDGIYYVSRRLNTKRAVVLFDKPATLRKLGQAHYTPLPKVRGAEQARKALGIVLAP